MALLQNQCQNGAVVSSKKIPTLKCLEAEIKMIRCLNAASFAIFWCVIIEMLLLQTEEAMTEGLNRVWQNCLQWVVKLSYTSTQFIIAWRGHVLHWGFSSVSGDKHITVHYITNYVTNYETNFTQFKHTAYLKNNLLFFSPDDASSAKNFLNKTF